MKHKQRKYLVVICILLLAFFSMSACSNKGKLSQEVQQDGQSNPTPTKEAEPTGEPQPTQEPEQQEVTPEPTSVPEDFEWPEDFSLHEAYEGQFLIGTIYTNATRSPKDKELALKHFNVLTPENLMKPEYMQPTEGNFNYGETNVMVSFAKENDLQLIGHTLAWHSQSGRWLGQNVSREVAIEQLKSHITNIVGNFKGEFLAWDVVNEAFNDGSRLPLDGDWTKCLRDTQWLRSIGPDYIEMAFTFAREADPDLKLYYNDYNLNNRAKADAVYAMVKDFKERGIPIDGIGMQGHYSVGVSIGTVEYSLERFSELGVEVSITELDVTVNGASPTGLTPDQEAAQAVTYAKLFQLFKKYSDTIERVTFWGTVDSKSWRKDRFPCLFNSDYTPKEAAYAVLDPDLYLSLHENKVGKVEIQEGEALYGTPVIDGVQDDLWKNAKEMQINKQVTAWEGATGTVRALWDENYVYLLLQVKDNVLNAQSDKVYEQDSIEVYLDQNNDKKAYYDENDGQYRVNYKGEVSFGTIPDKTGFTAVAAEIEGGYLVELAIPLVVTPGEGMSMGFDAQINDSSAIGIRQSIAKFSDTTDFSFQSTENWGILKLVKK